MEDKLSLEVLTLKGLHRVARGEFDDLQGNLRERQMQALLDLYQPECDEELICRCSYHDTISGTWPVLNELRANGDYLTF